MRAESSWNAKNAKVSARAPTYAMVKETHRRRSEEGARDGTLCYTWTTVSWCGRRVRWGVWWGVWVIQLGRALGHVHLMDISV